MANLSGIVNQLKKERDLVERQLTGLNAALTAFADVYGGRGTAERKVSASARRKMSLAQKARWAKRAATNRQQPKRMMSASARKKIAAAQRARWAKLKVTQSKARKAA